MATRTETSVTINFPPAKVHEALTNADYWAYNVANLSTEPGEVHEITSTDGGAEVVLPEAVRAMISQSLKIKRVYTIGALADGAAKASYTADVKGAPVDFKGDIELSGDDASTTLSYANEVNVTIPFMGPAIEPKVAEALSELVANEAALTEKWISENL